ncbi:MAG: endonuclease III [Candidatus Bathyarchaeota archaeon]|nr:endonuclease III [Candidatus Bathyarchaeota archaeon]MDH5494092.1 endonuclease III [Candidatus Bathyarchaeota archaeon]
MIKTGRRNYLTILDSRLLNTLEEKYGPLWETIWPEEYSFKDQFKKLVITILSQNTSNANTIRAYRGLAAKFEITPEVLASADIDQLKEAIRSGGLYNIKAKRLRDISKAVLEKFNGDVESVLALPKEEAKTNLMELPGIGDKTADVLLTSRYSYQKILPIDTHFDRVAKRVGIAKTNANYNEVQEAYMKFLPEAYRERASGLLWLLAKNTCRAQNPKCGECPLKEICEYGTNH